MPHQISDQAQNRTIEMVTSWKMPFWLLWKLPMAFFLGVRIKSCNTQSAETTLPFWWMSQNPFRSIYFAAQCSAAELSTGALVLTSTANSKHISTLLLSIESKYLKKATTRTTFRCEDGAAIQAAVKKALETGEGQSVTATSTATQKNGEIVSVTKVTWSFKVRS